MSTTPRISFGLFNFEINKDSTPAASGLQSWSKVEDLKTGNIMPLPYATYEPNFWLLDGGYKFKPDDDAIVHIGVMSTAMSDINGDFSSPPVLTVTFTHPHTSDGLVLRFSEYTGDWSDSITVAYYDINNVLICTNNYSPDSWEYEMDLDVDNFAKIIITFHSTNKAYRYLRLTGIDYGQLIYFTSAEIKSATVVEDIDMLSTSLPANSCDLHLYSGNSQFSIVSPTGYYARLSERQPISVYELVNTKPKYIGRYFLDTWKSTTEKEFEFNCMDATGLMDHIPYKGGLWLPTGVLSQDLFEQIMGVAALPFELAPELYDIPIMGWIPSGSCRDALRQVALSIGAFVDCSRSNLVKIKSTIILNGTENTVSLTAVQHGQNPSLNIMPLVTGVNITAHDYQEGAENVSLYNAPLVAGRYEITFKQPVHTLTATGATIVESGVNYAIIMVTTAGTVTLNGLNYIDSQQTFSASNPTLAPGAVTKIISVKDATLINSANGFSVANRIYSYYQERHLQKPKLYSPVVAPGDVVLSDTYSGKKILGVVEKMTLDLTGGFTAKTEIVGVVI